MKQIIHNLCWLVLNNTYKCWPDALWLKIIYRIKMRSSLNLKSPRLFTEKLQWLKLHDRNPRYSLLVDKYEVKKVVKECLGEEYVIPNYGVWNHFDEIDFDRLPDKFVLKCTHDSGNVWICKDKGSFDKASAREKLEESLKHNFFWWTREWPYKHVKGRIIAEKYMLDANNPDAALMDYKFYCFNGEPQIVMVSSGRFSSKVCFDYYDMNWNKLPLIWDMPNSDIDHPKPETFDKMIDVCKKLCFDKPHVRIDLYNISNKVYFGECTFYDSSGFCHFSPEEWNVKLGDMIKLPGK